MSTHSVSIAQRITGWLFSFIVFASVVLLSGKLGEVARDGRLAAAVLAGIVVTGELLARLGTRRPPARRDEMRALIAPFYAALRRTVQAQVEQDEDGGAAAADAPSFEFDAATAAIMQDEDSAYKNEAGQYVYEIKRYARSPEGEYFWLVLEAVDGEPRLVYIKHVAQHVARYALGGRYLPPPPRMT